MTANMELRATAEAPGTFIEAVQKRLREDIVSGRLAPREKLRLAELKSRYEMGTSPLREALSRLVGEGLVTFESNKGFRVRGLSKEDLADIAYMRTAVETFAIRTAIERGGMEWESGIVGSLHALVALTEDTATDRVSLDAWNVAHDRFHEMLLSACGSSRVFETQRQLAEQHNRYRRIFMGDNLPRQLIIDEHRNIAEAALARDADRAAALLGRHMVVTSCFYAKVLAGEKLALGSKAVSSALE
jgi:GntR family transcriptional regulator, carbon starvation induced regulator